MEQKPNIVLGPRYQLRLEDLQDWHLLEVTCASCGHSGLLCPKQLRRQLPGYTRIVTVEARFTCRHCGNGLGNSWRVMEQTGGRPQS